MTLKVIVTGLGGQGVVFLTRLLSQTAVSLNQPVMVSETHGMSQRGGSVISHLKISGSDAPLIRRGTADLLLALDADEASRNLTFLRSGGTAFVNTDREIPPALIPHLDRLGIQWCNIPASQIALEMGTAAVTNVIIVGFAVAHPTCPLPLETLRETVANIAPKAKSLNLKALAVGYEIGREGLRLEIERLGD
ncbi:MAG: indolepyruvate oxidoreductase [Chloroflexi bacterium]|nr:indolepyruvate oxidoreductase [Chloroflexota bacterium]